MTSRTAMLWCETKPDKTLAQVLKEASAHYKTKYGKTPNRCVIKLDTFIRLTNGNTAPLFMDGFVVEGHKNVRKSDYHIWYEPVQ